MKVFISKVHPNLHCIIHCECAVQQLPHEAHILVRVLYTLISISPGGWIDVIHSFILLIHTRTVLAATSHYCKGLYIYKPSPEAIPVLTWINSTGTLQLSSQHIMQASSVLLSHFLIAILLLFGTHPRLPSIPLRKQEQVHP